MARHWTEPFDPTRHRGHMEFLPPRQIGPPSLGPRLVLFVAVCDFAFEFHSLDQLHACLKFYSQKHPPSARRNIGGADHWELERWFERLPLYLREEPKRIQVVAALQRALDDISPQPNVASSRVAKLGGGGRCHAFSVNESQANPS